MRGLRTFRPRTAAALAACSALTVLGFAGIAHATTGPSPHTLVNVSISDTKLVLSRKSCADVTYVDFYLHNTGKKTHNFVIGATKSAVLRPGERVHMYVGFPVYGYYRYKVTLHAKPQMHGRFHVDSPQPPD